MRTTPGILVALSLAGCAAPPELGISRQPLTAVCEANVTGVGLIDTETDYLPHVVSCENGAAPSEALKVQAIAARTYLYFKMETAGAIGDGQSDQVYTCKNAPTAAHLQAVRDTEGLVLRYGTTTIAAFYVAGGTGTAPGCVGGTAATEKYVTYNEGLTGAAVEQTTLGFVDPSNDRNRGCMSQNGSSCLAGAGKTAAEILRFYYGADIGIEQAIGACITPSGQDAGVDLAGGDLAGADLAGDADAGHVGDDEQPSTDEAGCALTPTRPAPSRAPLLALFALGLTRVVRRRPA